MIERIELKDFKSHAHTRLELGRLTLLVGPNSSGKSSVLEALQILCRPDVLERRKDDIGTTVRDGKEDAVIHLQLFDPTSTSRPIRAQGWGRDGRLANPERIYQQSGADMGVAETPHLKLYPLRLAAPSYSDEIPPTVGDAGDGLASALAYFMTNEPDRFQVLMAQIKVVLPFVKAIRVRPAKVHRSSQKLLSVDDKSVPIDTSQDVVGHEMILDVEGARGVPSQAVSDGTLLVIGILTILASPSCPNLILLDDIEQGLHPKAQRELVGVLKRLLEERPELQIVATTHSPYVVDELDAKDVWVLAANSDGETMIRRLSDHPDAKKALEVLTTGEFLSAEGEDWVLEATDTNA